MPDLSPRPVEKPRVVDQLRTILLGKLQRKFVGSDNLLVNNWGLAIQELDACATVDELKLVARANNIEVTPEDLDFANEIKTGDPT